MRCKILNCDGYGKKFKLNDGHVHRATLTESQIEKVEKAVSQLRTTDDYDPSILCHKHWCDDHLKLVPPNHEHKINGRDFGDGRPDKPDAVNHPAHYTSHPSGVECITVTRHMGFNLGNAVKYLWRDGLKDAEVPTQDLEKAIWYIKDEISKRNGEARVDEA